MRKRIQLWVQAPLAVALLAYGLSAQAVMAQSASGSLSSFSKGYGGGGSSGLESPVDVSAHNANGDITIVNGVMQAPSGSIFSNLSNLGVSTTSTGAGSTSSTSTGSGSAVAIGNSLNVVVTGDYNTVVVNSQQTNTGAISASTVLNGKVNLDGGV